jgi:hypothetical protein
MRNGLFQCTFGLGFSTEFLLPVQPVYKPEKHENREEIIGQISQYGKNLERPGEKITCKVNKVSELHQGE